ncbi:phosphoribosylamine--glycine ligase [Candidatus Woesearchaeota archaeon]|nr:phosphoribosylamine--glycine ligase [Candidatus Woesearchaeota archaeon]
MSSGSGSEESAVCLDYGKENGVLVIGSGGREHSLVKKLAESPHVNRILASPGNPGMLCGLEGRLRIVPLEIPRVHDDMRRTISSFQHYFGEISKLTFKERISLVVVGPEQPICLGIADILDEMTNGGVAVFAPDAYCAQLEGSKHFAKQIMAMHGIPTAGLEMVVTKGLLDEAHRRIDRLGARNVVLKGNGLAAGKGVVVSDDDCYLKEALTGFFKSGIYGHHSCVLLEERLRGAETSAIAVCDGNDLRMLVPTRDHKPIFEGDLGPNTGGMGAYAPDASVSAEMSGDIRERIMRPLMWAMNESGHPYKGALYAGIILTDDGPKVLEINCRFGDPETQAQMALMESDLFPLLMGAAKGRLPEAEISWRDGYSHCLSLASYGYPGAYHKGWPIRISDCLPQGTSLAYAGVARDAGRRLVTEGGRVMYVMSTGNTLSQASERGYSIVEQGLVSFPGMTYRRDIGRGSSRGV